MKLTSLTFFGERWKNGRRYSGFGKAKLSDGSEKYIPESLSFENAAIPFLQIAGVDCSEYQAGIEARRKAMAYPPKPESREYQHDYGYQIPISLGDWQWSTTFGRWGRIVTFADGWTGLTWPKY